MEQPTGRSADRWARELAPVLGKPVRVRYGDARSRVVQAAWKERHVELRLSSFFRYAPDQVALDLGSWLKSGKRERAACKRLDDWIEERLAELPARAARGARRRARGEHHDLTELGAQVARFFGAEAGAIAPSPERFPELTWGRRGRRAARHSLRLGSYELAPNLVRVNPVLDQAAVPDWFVRYILFHEILHAAIPPRRGESGRTIHHGADFRRAERRYPEYARALEWQDRWLPSLLRSARSGRPVPAPKTKPKPPVRKRVERWLQLALFREEG